VGVQVPTSRVPRRFRCASAGCGRDHISRSTLSLTCTNPSLHPRSSAEAVWAVPNDASSPLLNSVGGAIVLVLRGGVTFASKVRHAQAVRVWCQGARREGGEAPPYPLSPATHRTDPPPPLPNFYSLLPPSQAGAAAVVIIDDGSCGEDFSCGGWLGSRGAPSPSSPEGEGLAMAGKDDPVRRGWSATCVCVCCGEWRAGSAASPPLTPSVLPVLPSRAVGLGGHPHPVGARLRVAGAAPHPPDADRGG
jgi:hypothetical protein